MTNLTLEKPAAPIPKAALRALIELTGQVELGPAILMTLNDAIQHRLESIQAEIQSYEKRYGMTFEQLESRGRSGDLPDSSSYRTEQEYFNWDSLITRQGKLNEILTWLG